MALLWMKLKGKVPNVGEPLYLADERTVSGDPSDGERVGEVGQLADIHAAIVTMMSPDGMLIVTKVPDHVAVSLSRV